MIRQKANNLTLYPHKEREFWLWMSSWAVFISRPSDLGYDDTGYAMPPMNVVVHELPTDHAGAGSDRDGQGFCSVIQPWVCHRQQRKSATAWKRGLPKRSRSSMAPEDHFCHLARPENRAPCNSKGVSRIAGSMGIARPLNASAGLSVSAMANPHPVDQADSGRFWLQFSAPLSQDDFTGIG